MQPVREGFERNDETMGEQQVSGTQSGGVSMDATAINTDDVSLNTIPQTVNDSPGRINYGNAGSSPERVGNSFPWGAR